MFQEKEVEKLGPMAVAGPIGAHVPGEGAHVLVAARVPVRWQG